VIFLFPSLDTHAKATPVATATVLPPELPPVIYQSETSTFVWDDIFSLSQTAWTGVAELALEEDAW